jgi:4-carboxymuconolactone decarboxylase
VSEHERRLRSLALNDESVLASLLGARLDPDELSGLDAKTLALVRLGAVVALGASPVTYQWATQAALAAGASDEEVVGTLTAVAPVSGLTRAVLAAPELAIALGHDVDEALERVANPGGRDD